MKTCTICGESKGLNNFRLTSHNHRASMCSYCEERKLKKFRDTDDSIEVRPYTTEEQKMIQAFLKDKR